MFWVEHAFHPILTAVSSLSFRHREEIALEEGLVAVNEAIAKTEAVIAKLRQVCAGLLHELLTRGLNHNRQLRDPIAHPEQFQDSPLGQIPKEWTAAPLRHF